VSPSPRPTEPEHPRLDKNLPANLFNGMIHPLIPYSIRGAIWYQGESNASTPYADLYGRQLATMIQDWRSRWSNDFSFAWVQLPEYEPRTDVAQLGWPVVRAEMARTLSLTNTGMAVTLGLGDPDNVHPKAKQAVGKRLSSWALAELYDQPDLIYRAPLYAGHEINDNSVTITFDHADGGLSSTSLNVTGFVIAGSDRKWFEAEAQIGWDEVTVSSPDVPAPVAVRYAWAANPAWSLMNGADLPVSPFRTDAWELALPSVARSENDHMK
jgi:hypothetical protein